MRTVAAAKPPMTAKAMGPQNTVEAIGIMPSTVAAALSRIGRMRLSAAAMTASQPARPAVPFRLDLLDQDHRIARDHADQGQRAEDGDEAQRPARQQQAADDADHPERRYAQHQQQAAGALQLDHQDANDDQQHGRHDRQ